ncbi:MAG: rod shape-determining protein MreC [Candidatus Kerfeldbacteria bacterium]
MKKILATKWGMVILGIIIVIVLISLTRFGVFKFADSTMSYAFSPIQSFFSSSADKISNFFVYFSDIKDLQKENESLNEEISLLTVENLQLQSTIKSSEIVLEELKYITEYNYNSVTAKIVSRGIGDYLNSIIINKGLNDNIQKGFPVIANSGHLIGKIIEVNDYTSKVILLNDNHSKVSALIQNSDLSPGIVAGQYGITLRMILVPQDQLIQNEEIVITSGIEEFIPADLIIGKISGVFKKESELFQEADVEPIVDYSNLSIVSVILPVND